MSRHSRRQRHDRAALRLATRLGVLFGLAGLGASSAALAVDAVADAFGVGRGQAIWCLSLYAVTLAVGTMVFGHLADSWGTRRPLVVAVVLMSVGAAVAASAPVFALLLAARIAQGAGAAGVLTVCVLVLADTVDGARRPAALMRLAAWGACLSCLGPLVAGVLVDAGHWRLAMALPVLGVLVMPFVTSALHTRRSDRPHGVATPACTAAIVAGAVLVLQSPSTGWASAITGASLVAVFTAALLVLRRRASSRRSLADRVRTHRVLVRGAVVAACVPASWFALLVAMPAMLGDAGWSTSQVGLALVPSAVVGLATPAMTGARLGNRDSTARVSFAASCAAFALLLAAAGSAVGFEAVVVVSAAAVTIAFAVAQPSLAALVAENVAADHQGSALGAATLVFIAGGSVGSAVLAGLTPQLGLAGALPALAVLPLAGAVVAARASARIRVAADASTQPRATRSVRQQAVRRTRSRGRDEEIRT